MSEDATTETTTEAATETTQTEQATAANSVQELPEWAQKLIIDVRADAAKYRTEAKTAAEQAQAELAARFGKVFGFGEEEAAADPEALARAATEAQQNAAKAARELAIFKAASTAGADPNRLLGWSPFMSSVEGLDPSDGAAITAAIQSAVADNSFLKAVQAAAASGTELGGTGETGQITEEQLRNMTQEQIAKAFDEGRLKHLL
jgi:hypothetical protein